MNYAKFCPYLGNHHYGYHPNFEHAFKSTDALTFPEKIQGTNFSLEQVTVFVNVDYIFLDIWFNKHG